MARPLDPDRRRRILEAALRVFTREGYRRASVASVAREADVAKGSLYSYFASKEDLFGEMFLDVWASDLAMLRAAAEKGRDPERTLRRLFDGWIEAAEGLDSLTTVFLDFLAECGRDHMAPAIRGRASALYLEARDVIADLIRSGVRRGKIRRGVDARATAQSIIAFWDGVFAARLIVGDAVDIRRTSRTFLGNLMRGIRA